MKSQSEIRNLIKQKRLSLTKEEVESLSTIIQNKALSLINLNKFNKYFVYLENDCR